MKTRIIMLITSTIILQLLFASSSLAANYHGKVIDETGIPIPFVTVVALSPNDSTYVTGAMTDEMGLFSFDAEQRPLLLKVSNIGFQTKWLSAMSADLGVITLQPETTRLNEVVVTAKPS